MDKFDQIMREARGNINEKTYEMLVAAAKEMTSEERIHNLSGYVVENMVLAAEIEYRTGIDYDIADRVTTYEGLNLKKYAPVLNFEDVAADVEREEGIDRETAMKVLLCEEDIYVECGISVPAQ